MIKINNTGVSSLTAYVKSTQFKIATFARYFHGVAGRQLYGVPQPKRHILPCTQAQDEHCKCNILPVL